MSLLHQLFSNPLLLLFTILAAGCFVGKAKIFGIELGSSGGVLFVALAFGQLNYSLPDMYRSFGFAIFIYAIGFGAGPRFFQTFRQNGIKYGLVAVFVVFVGSIVAFACACFFKMPTLYLPGILAGALTSTSTLAAAYDKIHDPILSIGYGITYPFGLIGLLLMIQALPRWLHIDLKKEAARENVNEPEEDEGQTIFQIRVFKVRNPGIVRVPLKELQLRDKTGIGIVLIRHGDQIEFAQADSQLELNDNVLAEGDLSQLLELEEYIGPEVMDEKITGLNSSSARVVVSNKHAINRSPRELGLARNFGVIVTRLQRGGIDLPVNPDFKLERGDTIAITGHTKQIKMATRLLGRKEHKIFETDMFTFSIGLFLGALLGLIKWPIIHASLGVAGGLLFTGILFGYLRNFGPFSGRVPIAARYIMQELGLMLFLAGVGVQAGHGFLDHLLNKGMPIFATGVLITTFTLVSTLVFCRYILKFDWNTSFGATTGGVTSTVALKVVTEEAESQYPVLGYAGVYAFANILLTILGQIIVMFA